MTRGRWKPKRHKKLVSTARAVLAHAQSCCAAVQWLHVKGHSGDVGNDRADALAREGAAGSRAAPRVDTAAARDPISPPEVGGVRWIGWDPSESARVARALTKHGVLNLVADKAWTRQELSRAAAKVARRVRADEGHGRTSAGDGARAVASAREAVAALTAPGVAATERAARRRGWATCTVRCEVNAPHLLAYARVHADRRVGAHDGVTYVDAVDRLMRATWVEDGRTYLSLTYKYSVLGRDLITAGHISAARETAVGPDPFKWPKDLRQAAFVGLATEYDDTAAFIAARCAMVPTGAGSSASSCSRTERSSWRSSGPSFSRKSSTRMLGGRK